jgi:hypothetical protein
MGLQKDLQMEWTVSFLKDQRIVVIETSGVADGAGSFEMTKSISKAMATHLATRCLIDHTAITSISGSISEVYYRPQRVFKFNIPFRIKIAEVVLPAHKRHFDFLETVFRNRGFDFSVFNDREPAIQWLTK